MSSDVDDMEDAVAVAKGITLAERLMKRLGDKSLSPHDRILMWIGLYTRLHLMCDNYLGRAYCDHVLNTATAAHHQQRAKAALN